MDPTLPGREWRKTHLVQPLAIQGLLGRDGMAAVYLSDHLNVNRKVAISLLTPVTGKGQQFAAELFLGEARAAAALDDPNIGRVLGVSRYPVKE